MADISHKVQTIKLEFDQESKRMIKALIKALHAAGNHQLANSVATQKPVEDMGWWDPNGATTLAPETFIDSEGVVISHKGENYYKGCGKTVMSDENGLLLSICIKRINHTSELCEDFDGNTREN